MVTTPEEALEAAKTIHEKTGTNLFIIKAQIHAGGRGKGTIKETGSKGVVITQDINKVKSLAEKILGGTLVTLQTGEMGKKVNKIYISHDVYYAGEEDPKELYFSILLDRSTSQNMIIASTEGGVNIEEVAEKTPDLIVKEHIDPMLGLQNYQARKIAFALGMSGISFKNMVKFITLAYQAYVAEDLSLLEINPLLRASDGEIIAVDAKVCLDDNGLFRHKDTANYRDTSEEDLLEVEASENNLNYVKLDGNVGCMVNGAGLAMATMDMIKLSGGNPANFLDVGGGANAQAVEAGFRIMLKDPGVKIILINIFGGIVRCDRVANGVVEAYKNIGDIKVPIIVRLQGTNAEEGTKIIHESGLKVIPTVLLKDAAEKVKEILN